MGRTATISLTEEDYLFLEEMKKKGSKPTAMFRKALDSYRELRDTEKYDLKIAEMKQALGISNMRIMKLEGYIDHKRQRKDFEKWDTDGKNEAAHGVE